MIINDLFNNKKQDVVEDTQADSQRKQYPNYYQHKDAGTIFRIQNDDGTTRDITPNNTEEWDDYYRQQFPDMTTPNDGGFWNDDNTAAYVEGNGFDVVSNYADMRTTDTGNKSNQTYTSTTIQKNPATGQQKSLAKWDHTDPKTGKNYSGSNYIDAQGNAEVQKNYEESQHQLDELDKKTVASWVRQQPQRIKGDSGLSRTDFKKAKRLVDKSIPTAIAKYKDPSYGKQEPRLEENMSNDMAEGWTKLPSGDYQNSHTGVRTSKPPAKKKRGEKTGAEWDAIEKAKKEQGVAEGFSLKKTNVDKYMEPGDPDEYTQDVNIKDTDYEIINNKTGQIVGTASWTTNDFMGPGALKITMKNGATRWLDIWASEQGNPQSAFNRFVKDPKTAKKYKEQGMAEGAPDHWSPMGKDSIHQDRIRSLQNLIAIAKEQGRQLRVQELELALKKLQGVNEVSLGDYRKKAAVSQAGAKIDRFFDRDDPAKVAAADQTIAKRQQGLARADARTKPYTPPPAAPVDLEKQQRDLTAKYPNIDELVRRAELNRDPDYEMADGQAYYAARDAEQNYQKLRQIQRVIQGLNESLNRSHLP